MATLYAEIAPLRHRLRQELVAIEQKLHPLITIDGREIFHKHLGQRIIFYARIGDMPLNNREFHLLRDTVLNCKNFYLEYKPELEWLVERDLAWEVLNGAEE